MAVSGQPRLLNSNVVAVFVLVLKWPPNEPPSLQPHLFWDRVHQFYRLFPLTGVCLFVVPPARVTDGRRGVLGGRRRKRERGKGRSEH